MKKMYIVAMYNVRDRIIYVPTWPGREMPTSFSRRRPCPPDQREEGHRAGGRRMEASPDPGHVGTYFLPDQNSKQLLITPN